ncbi:MAG: TonB-dependent receptor [Bdellovibrionota bacterium]
MRLFLILFLFIQGPAFALDLKLKILEKGSKNPMKDISVFLLPDKIKGQTSQSGEVVFQNLPEAPVQVVISAAGYNRLEKSIEPNRDQDQIIYLERESYGSFETVITDAKNKRDQSQKTLTRKEFLAMPGANGDAVKAVQNLPGVNRVAGFSSQVVIQGSAPQDTAYNFEGHDIPIVFHFGGLGSVVMPEALEQVDYLSAGYQSDYSRALGGIISLKTRKPDVNERPKKGLFYLDNLSAGGLVETKIDDKSSFLMSGRYSYIGFFLKSALKDSDMLDLTVAPEFQDFTAVYHRDISDDEVFKLSLLGSRDRLAFILDEPLQADPSIRGNFSNTVDFFRLIPAWTKKKGDNLTYRLSAGVGRDHIGLDFGDQYFDLKSNVLTLRGEEERRWSEKWLTQIGFDNRHSDTLVKLKSKISYGQGGVENPFSTGDQRQVDVKIQSNDLGLYLRSEYQWDERLTLGPGVRYDRYSVVEESHLSPRFIAKYKASPSLLYKMGTGVYTQPPEPQESSVDVGNPNIKSPKAIHVTIGVEKDFRVSSLGTASTGSTFGINLFDRWYDQLVVASSDQVTRDGNTVLEMYNNEGRGRAYGLELQWKFNENDYNGFVSYTLSRSKRWSASLPAYDFEYDQTHNLNIVYVKPLPREWKISTRFRYVTGNPYTPVVGSVYDADNEVYFPVRGPIYSERLKDFYQLDLRIDKKVIYDQSIWSYYLDIQNVLNTKNPESIQYSYDYSQKNQISGLPFLPAIGVKGEF